MDRAILVTTARGSVVEEVVVASLVALPVLVDQVLHLLIADHANSCTI